VFWLMTILAATPPSLACVPFSGPGLSVEKQTFFTDHFSQQLEAEGFSVMTSGKMGALLGLDRQRALLGCSESACAAEIAAALGVDLVLRGSVGLLGDRYQTNVQVLDARDGKTVASYSGSTSNEAGIIDELNRAARAVALALRPAPPSRVAQVVTMAGGLSATGVGVALLIGSASCAGETTGGGRSILGARAVSADSLASLFHRHSARKPVRR
jgi:TolB-like protein